MEQAAKEKRSGQKTRATAIFIAGFICVWLSGMTASLTAGACRNDLNEGAKKLRLCTISLSAGAWMKVFPIERAKGAIIHLERGIALHQIGQDDKARAAFDKALHDSRSKQGAWEQGLHQRMAQLDDPKALALWVSVAGAAD